MLPRVRFTAVLDVDAPVEALWAFHERPDVLQLLQPPWERAEVVKPPRSLEVGTRVVVRVRLGPIPMIFEAEHIAYERGRRFVDRMVRGPFRSWVHEHRFEARGAGSRLIDDVDYQLPLGRLGRLAGGAFAARRLERLFEFRHRVTREHVEGGQAGSSM
jgi:ligand-binding SRPBCC domain-containing protein